MKPCVPYVSKQGMREEQKRVSLVEARKPQLASGDNLKRRKEREKEKGRAMTRETCHGEYLRLIAEYPRRVTSQ